MDPPSFVEDLLDVLHLGTTQRGLDVRETKVVPGQLMPVVPFAQQSMTSIETHLIVKVLIACHNHATFASSNRLGRLEAERPYGANCPSVAAGLAAALRGKRQ